MKAPPAGLVLLAATIAWGSTFVVTASLLEVAPPLTYLALRFGAAVVVLLPLLPRMKTSRGLLRDALVLGLLNAVGLLLQVFGQCYTTAAKSAFITSLNTPLTALGGLLLYRQLPTRAQRVAIVLATAGLCLLTWPPPGARINPGDLYTVGCAILYAVFIVESARRAPRHDAITMAILQVVIAAALFGGCAVLARSIHVDAQLLQLEARPFPHGPRVLWQMAYMSIVCVAVTMLAQDVGAAAPARDDVRGHLLARARRRDGAVDGARRRRPGATRHDGRGARAVRGLRRRGARARAAPGGTGARPPRRRRPRRRASPSRSCSPTRASAGSSARRRPRRT